MSVVHKTLFGIGKEFNEISDLIEFMESQSYEVKFEYVEDIQDQLTAISESLVIEPLNHYTGEGYFLGFVVNVADCKGVDHLRSEIYDKSVKWFRVFSVDPDVVDAVVVY